jgi:hypothetical protein
VVARQLKISQLSRLVIDYKVGDVPTVYLAFFAFVLQQFINAQARIFFNSAIAYFVHTLKQITLG